VVAVFVEDITKVVAVVVGDVTEMVAVVLEDIKKCGSGGGVSSYRGCSVGGGGNYRDGAVVLEDISDLVTVVV
jgi:hypothetical protein